jgi:PmbA protein
MPAAPRPPRGHAGIARSTGQRQLFAAGMHLAATNGFSGGYARSSRSVSCVAITGDRHGMERDWAANRASGRPICPTPKRGRIGGERTLARAGARKPPTGSLSGAL